MCEQAAIQRIAAIRKRGKSLRTIAAAMTATGHKLSHEGVAKVPRAAAGEA
jgi:hypothetical protein